MNRLRHFIPWMILPLLLVVPLVLAACGGDEGLSEAEVARIAQEAATAAAAQAAAQAAAPDVDVAAAGGWKNPETMKLAYQHADTETMVTVVTEPRRIREA